jgi:hypothetical protein
MELPDLKHNFYNAFVDEVRVGPRQELNLSMELWPGDRIGGEGKFVSIRFGGIVNFGEVQEFFADFDNSANAHEGLHWLRYDEAKNSKPGDLFIKMQFDRTEDEVLVHCKNITISD